MRFVATLADCRPEDLRIDLPMRVVFRPLEFPGTSRQVVAPMFTPAV